MDDDDEEEDEGVVVLLAILSPVADAGALLSVEGGGGEFVGCTDEPPPIHVLATFPKKRENDPPDFDEGVTVAEPPLAAGCAADAAVRSWRA